ncbi:MAG TPA: LysR family transcriptional regulator [Burkholderiaceae bacterium]
MKAQAPISAAIELRAWRQFVALAEQLHYGRAAAALHMTQPPLTLAIQQLEQRLGVLLFERTRRSVTLTSAGAALLEPARALLRQAAALPALARSAAVGESGRVRLGFISTVGFGPLPGWLRGFRAAHPRIAVELHEATSDVQLRAFERGELDAGFVLHAPGMAPGAAQGLEALSLGVEPLVLALAETLPWVRAPRLRVREVLAQPLVVFPRVIAPSLYDALLAFYHRQGATPAIAQEAIQMQTIVNLVSAGIGIAWVPRSVMQFQRAGVVYRQAGTALAAPQAETSLVWSAGANEPAVQRFVEFVRKGPAGR